MCVYKSVPLTELGVRVPELVQDAAAREWWDVDVGDECDLPGILSRGILGAVDALQLVFGNIGLGLGDLHLSSDNKTLPLRLSGGCVHNRTVVSLHGLSIVRIITSGARGVNYLFCWILVS